MVETIITTRTKGSREGKSVTRAQRKLGPRKRAVWQRAVMEGCSYFWGRNKEETLSPDPPALWLLVVLPIGYSLLETSQPGSPRNVSIEQGRTERGQRMDERLQGEERTSTLFLWSFCSDASLTGYVSSSFDMRSPIVLWMSMREWGQMCVVFA